MSCGRLSLSFLLALGGIASAQAREPIQKLPPKQKKSASQAELGDSKAVEEVRRMTEDSGAMGPSTDTSGAVPPISISPAIVQSIEKPKQRNSEQKTPEPAKVSSVDLGSSKKSEVVAPEPPQAKLWLVLDKKPELGFLTGWAFARKELATLVGDGFSYGFLAAQEMHPGIQAQLRLSGSHHREKDATRKSSLNLFPFEFLAQFAQSAGNLKFYVQPGLGGAAWTSRSERLVDGRVQKANGFDFMASAGLGFKYKIQENPWSVGADASMAYVSGYFDNYFSRVLVYSTYQF
jgi:hypothetical protein